MNAPQKSFIISLTDFFRSLTLAALHDVKAKNDCQECSEFLLMEIVFPSEAYDVDGVGLSGSSRTERCLRMGAEKRFRVATMDKSAWTWSPSPLLVREWFGYGSA